ncbi:potassium transport protein TRK1/TRK2 [Xylariomycetidae sp. FL2044]|nr:potassium transport protein TRK1/TRK2 [Xylariomycetidae sp. FL2044]
MPNSRERVLGWMSAIRPSFLSKKPHFNFITAHYFWIIGWTMIGSILIFAPATSQLAYIDALFLASGANTQAGLNTVDINLLNTFQQIVIYLLAMISNPITIHSSVVFLRLYWFEKRFQHIAREARQRRATISKSRSKAKQNPGDVEKGVNGRNIRVMYDTAKASRMTNDGILLKDVQLNGVGQRSPLSPSPLEEDNSEHSTIEKPPRLPPPQIKFADQVMRSDAIESDDDDRDTPLPQKRTDAEHIAILERQRKADKSVLRIPGPRDADRGALPEEVDEDDDEAPGLTSRRRRESSLEQPQRDSLSTSLPPNADRPQTITIEEPKRPRRETDATHEAVAEDFQPASHTQGGLKFRKPRKDGDQLPHTDTATSSATHRGLNPLRRIKTALTHNKDEDPMPPYLSWQPTLGRNSVFIGLTEEQREELGGIEYRSLKTLALVLTIYFWGYSLFAMITLVPWIVTNNERWGRVVDAAGVNRTWWGFFTANSAFMDLGYTLTPDSMISFKTAQFPLLIMSFLIVIGNTAFPIMLRFMIWLFSLVVPKGSGIWEELKFLLDHPRRCFTLLFPSNATWWLFFILVVLNGVDLILFIILDLNAHAVSDLPLNIRFLDGWFQAASTRTAGFACVNLSLLHPAIQTSYLIMMYISVFPVAISIRRTNVYEEKSLGVYGGPSDDDDSKQSGVSYVGNHLRRQLSFDLWYLFVGYFLLTITEGSRLMLPEDQGGFSMFAVLFEVVSAYGTVGLSLGYGSINASLCSQFTVLGKLIVIAMQIRGRHRGLPYGLDRAVLLPSENLDRKEAEEAGARQDRRQSSMSVAGDGTRRPSSLVRGRSRSVDKRHMLTGLLHPGPIFPHHSLSKAKSEAKTENSLAIGRSETLRQFASTPENKIREEDDEPPLSPTTRRTTQPAFDH